MKAYKIKVLSIIEEYHFVKADTQEDAIKDVQSGSISSAFFYQKDLGIHVVSGKEIVNIDKEIAKVQKKGYC